MIALSPFALKCLLLIACHLIGDFAFQNAWMVAEKGKSWEVNGYHALTYTAPFVFLAFAPGAVLTLGALLVILVTHFWIDALKARWQVIKHIWMDQLCHFGVLAGLLAIGWL